MVKKLNGGSESNAAMVLWFVNEGVSKRCTVSNFIGVRVTILIVFLFSFLDGINLVVKQIYLAFES